MADDMTLILSDWMNGRGILDRRCVAATDLDQTEWPADSNVGYDGANWVVGCRPEAEAVEVWPAVVGGGGPAVRCLWDLFGSLSPSWSRQRLIASI
eukprot:scaffold2306_cov179-Alexandrium_tamarense.AAC.21